MHHYSKNLKGFVELSLADFLVRSAYQMGKTPLLPIFAALLGASDLFLGLIVSVSTFTGMILKPLIGFLSDRWGRRAWLILGTLFFTLMPFVYMLIETPRELFIVRIIHGLATAIYGPVTLAYIAQTAKTRVAEKLGWFSMARSAGYIVGPALAGVLLLSISPASVFSIIGLISAAAFIPILLLPEPDVHTKHSSFHEELRAISQTFQQSSTIWFAGGLEAVNYVVLYALKAFLPIYALSAGYNVALVGTFFAVQEAVLMLLKPFCGRLGDRVGYLASIATGMLLLGLTVILLMSVRGAWLLMLLAALSGAAQAFIFPNSLALVAKEVNTTKLGLAMGLVGSLRNAGKVLGPILGGLLTSQFDYGFSFQLLGFGLVLAATCLGFLSFSRRLPVTLAEGTD